MFKVSCTESDFRESLNELLTTQRDLKREIEMLREPLDLILQIESPRMNILVERVRKSERKRDREKIKWAPLWTVRKRESKKR